MKSESFCIIVQARSGSARLPQKMLKPFYQDRTILQLLLERLRRIDNIVLVLATTDNVADDVLASMAENMDISVFRGSEHNVLDRFISAASLFGCERIVRVCADNPFLNTGLLEILMKEYKGEDYLSFRYSDGRPAILGHIGLTAEIVTRNALERVAEVNPEPFYLEHVTNYLYTHPDRFNIRLLDLPGEMKEYENIRLTVDTEEDFVNSATLYAKFPNTESMQDILSLIGHIRSDADLMSAMINEIKRNTK